MKKLIRFLSPKEHREAGTAALNSGRNLQKPHPEPNVARHEVKRADSWEPLNLKHEVVAPATTGSKGAPGQPHAIAASQHTASPSSDAGHDKDAEKKEPQKTASFSDAFDYSGTLEKLKSTYLYFKHNRKAAAILITGIITILFYKQVIPLYVILIFIAAASISKIVQDYIPFVIGFDLVMFVMVLSGASYGWKAAIVVGPISSLIGSSLRRISSQQFDTIVFPAISYGIVAVILPYLPPMSIFWLGMVCTTMYVILQNLVFAYLRPDIFNHITFTVTSLAFNYWLFMNFAEPIFSVIS